MAYLALSFYLSDFSLSYSLSLSLFRHPYRSEFLSLHFFLSLCVGGTTSRNALQTRDLTICFFGCVTAGNSSICYSITSTAHSQLQPLVDVRFHVTIRSWLRISNIYCTIFLSSFSSPSLLASLSISIHLSSDFSLTQSIPFHCS